MVMCNAEAPKKKYTAATADKTVVKSPGQDPRTRAEHNAREEGYIGDCETKVEERAERTNTPSPNSVARRHKAGL